MVGGAVIRGTVETTNAATAWLDARPALWSMVLDDEFVACVCGKGVKLHQIPTHARVCAKLRAMVEAT